jgi:hypothetical protein
MVAFDLLELHGDDIRNQPLFSEADAQKTDIDTVITDLLTGQYTDPIPAIGFNTAEGWSEDVSADVSQKLRRRCDLQLRDVPFFLQDLIRRHEGRYATFNCRRRCAWSKLAEASISLAPSGGFHGIHDRRTFRCGTSTPSQRHHRMRRSCSLSR